METEKCEMATGTDIHNRPKPENEREYSGLLAIQLMFQHQSHKTVSIFQVQIPIKSAVRLLKEDMAPRLKTPPEHQEWYYKGEKLSDNDSLLSKSIGSDSIITVKELPPGEVSQEKVEIGRKKPTVVAEETQQDYADEV